ncbi:MAG: IclR family transcriptional regulator [Gaiellales bacterium]
MSRTAERTFDLLERVARSEAPLGLMELASETEIDKSTAARLLGFLEQRSLVARGPETRKYTVGMRLISISTLALRQLDLPRLAHPELVALRDETAETTNLHIRVGDEALCLTGVESEQVVRRVLPLGEHRALSAGPAAKAILAFLPEREAAEIAARVPAGAQRRRLLDQLRAIREDGYIAVVGDRTPGVGAISVPVFGQSGVEASITVAGPAERWALDAMRAAVPRVLDAAKRLSQSLGGVA